MRRFSVLLALVGCAGDPAPAELDAVDALHQRALPYYRAGEHGSFVGAGGATITYVAFRHAGARRAVVFAPGRTEGSHTFMQLAYDLRDEPLDVFMIDHRGQGASSRLLPDPLKGHVDAFVYYVDDLAQLVATVVEPGGYDRVFGAAHSMGGAITLAYALEHPDALDGIVLSAPMLQINPTPFDEPTLLWYADSVRPDTTTPSALEEEFVGNILTNDPDQFAALYETDAIFPERRVGPATYGWVAQAIRATRAIRERAGEVTPPIRLFNAAADTIVMPEATRAFCAAAPRCELVDLANAKHELFFAEPATRDALLTGMLDLFQSI